MGTNTIKLQTSYNFSSNFIFFFPKGISKLRNLNQNFNQINQNIAIPLTIHQTNRSNFENRKSGWTFLQSMMFGQTLEGSISRSCFSPVVELSVSRGRFAFAGVSPRAISLVKEAGRAKEESEGRERLFRLCSREREKGARDKTAGANTEKPRGGYSQ